MQSIFFSGPGLGVSGCTKSIGGGLGVVGSSGHTEASSSGINVDTDGDVFKDPAMSTLSSAGSVEMPKLFIVSFYPERSFN